MAARVALFLPFLNSLGVSMSTGVKDPIRATFLTYFVILVWVGTILVGCLRRHENEQICFMDSIGLPSILTATIYALHIGV